MDQTDQRGDLAGELIAFSTGFDLAQVPAEAIQRVRDAITDTLGCMVLGARETVEPKLRAALFENLAHADLGVEFAADEVRDLYDVRIALERQACASAFDRGISADAIADIVAADGIYQELVQGKAIATRADADQAFHLCRAGLSGNAVLVKMLGENFGRA